MLAKILVASPGDCTAERNIVSEVIDEWNANNADSYSVILQCIKWESNTFPELGGRPQAIVNKQIVNDCDIIVGIFWTRFGSPTGKFESGTEEEIMQFKKNGKPVMLYFSNKAIQPHMINENQYNKLIKFKSDCQRAGLVVTVDSENAFRSKFRNDLQKYMNQYKQRPKKGHESMDEQYRMLMLRAIVDIRDRNERATQERIKREKTFNKTQFEEIIGELEKARMVRSIYDAGKNPKYEITQKGLRYLKETENGYNYEA